MRIARYFLKALNPLVWLVNWLCYLSHLESQRGATSYQPYDFNTDLSYF